jgi:aspartate racemase
MLLFFKACWERLMGGNLVGVIGGMGPLATSDFLRKLVEVSPATRDQAHIPVIVWGDPRTPDRTEALLHNGPSPQEALCAAARTLESAGAGALVIACNTAHAWAKPIRDSVSIPLISMVDAVINRAQNASIKRLGLMATRGTIFAQIYHQAAHKADIEIYVPSEEYQVHTDFGISAVKAGRLEEARPAFQQTLAHLLDRDVEAVVQACTEIPFAMADNDSRLIDTNRVLAQAAFEWSQRVNKPESEA